MNFSLRIHLDPSRNLEIGNHQAKIQHNKTIKAGS